jgi:hypothetical protein
MMREIDPEADNDGGALPLEQDSSKLGAVDEQVVGPFDPGGGRMAPDGFVQGHGRDQSESRRGRIARLDANQSGCVEIAGGRLPGPALPALAAGLPVGAKPEAFRSAFARQRGDIVVGGTRLGDGADQNRACAALRVAMSSAFQAR